MDLLFDKESEIEDEKIKVQLLEIANMKNEAAIREVAKKPWVIHADDHVEIFKAFETSSQKLVFDTPGDDDIPASEKVIFHYQDREVQCKSKVY
jgi:hypothetical protein